MSIEGIRNAGLIVFAVFIISIVLGALFLSIALWKLRKLNIPPNAGFAETLHYTPLIVVIGVDLLDLALDVLAAPISWIILDRLGLKGLRGVAAVEAVIPGTQLIPTLTLSWFAVRMFGIR